MRLKGEFYKNVVRPNVLYGSKCWAVDSEIEQGKIVVEMIMIRQMSGVTRERRIRKEYVRKRC